ncbi:MAG: SpoIID/LytB domain-containing protein [Simkaniaceae bacterium]
MRLLLALNFLLIPFCYCSIFTESELSVIERDKPSTLKVLLKKSIDGALVEVKGPHKVYNPLDGRLLSKRHKGRRYWLHPVKNGIKWGNEFNHIHQIRIIPNNARSSILVGGMQYRGCLDVYLIDDKISLVNEVDVENYLKSTLTSKVEEAQSDEVMDAIVITARTHAYFTAMHNAKSFWHVDAETEKYEGQGITQLNGRVDRAVDATKHLVMLLNSQPFAASWNQNCAGKTASFKAIHRKNVNSTEGVAVPIAEKERKNFHWCFTMGKKELASVLNSPQVAKIDLFLDRDSDKVYAVRVNDGKLSKDYDFEKLQEKIGKKNLASNDFTVKVKNNQILFEGFGKGNGVGLCLFTAEKLAKGGEIAPKILSQFFPYTRIEKVRSYDELSEDRVRSVERAQVR